MSLIVEYSMASWQPQIDNATQHTMLTQLEQGHVIYLPQLTFTISAQYQSLIDPAYLATGKKNISYNAQTDAITGFNRQLSDANRLQTLMRDFSTQASQLLSALFPHYHTTLRRGRTSFRPAEVHGRTSSRRKDDTLLHVDAFPSTPMRGERILRLFSNVNPNKQARQWHLGESFAKVMARFVPKIRRPIPGSHSLLKAMGLTKRKRTLYDHYMLNLHNQMKQDQTYQQQAIQQSMAFPPNSTWIVFTDLVSHAALAGQHVLEQTFYLPPNAQLQPKYSPLKQLEQYLQQPLL